MTSGGSVSSGGWFVSLGLSPVSRRRLFYTGCVSFRLLLVLVVIIWGGNNSFSTILGCLLGMGAIVGWLRTTSVWWHRKTHAILLSIAAIVCLLSQVLPPGRARWIVSGILLTDILYGLIHSAWRRPFITVYRFDKPVY